MLQLIDDLKGLPGVIGANIIHPDNGIEANNLPSLFKTDKLAAVGKLLTKAFAAGQLNFKGLNDLMFSYEEAAIVCRSIGKSRILSVFCDPGVNLNLLIMSMNLSLEQRQTSFEVGTLDIPPDQNGNLKTNRGRRLHGDSIPKESPLTKEFGIIKTQLNKIMGPISKIVFDEALDDWQQTGGADRTNLDRLIELIGQQINDQDKTIHFRNLVRAALNSED